MKHKLRRELTLHSKNEILHSPMGVSVLKLNQLRRAPRLSRLDINNQKAKAPIYVITKVEEKQLISYSSDLYRQP
jgi:hypothetical protein